ncbi:MAG TPA: hypothetical protein DD733_10300 [Clostridiales bacterium]|nr:hypothetical protein [Clostridiales bacterium]
MTPEEIAMKLTAHDHEIKSIKHRTNDIEKQQEKNTDLVIAINKMATTMEGIQKEQINQSNELKEQRKQLDIIDRRPAEDLRHYKRAIITGTAMLILGAILGAIFALIFK